MVRQNSKWFAGIDLGRLAAAAAALVLAFALNARAVDPCCSITAINTKTGIVTARVNSTGQTFQFAVKNAATLRSLKIGQAIFANFTAKQASLDGRTASFPIVNFSPVDSARAGGNSFSPVDGARATVNPFSPVDSAKSAAKPVACCTIVSFSPVDSMVMARETATGRTFQFKAAPSVLKTLKVGQAVFANFGTHQVSFDGVNPSGQITSVAAH